MRNSVCRSLGHSSPYQVTANLRSGLGTVKKTSAASYVGIVLGLTRVRTLEKGVNYIGG